MNRASGTFYGSDSFRIQDCEEETFVDVPSDEGLSFRRRCTEASTKYKPNRPPVLPTNNSTPTSAENGNWGFNRASRKLIGDMGNVFRRKSSTTNQGQDVSQDSKQRSSAASSTVPPTKHIHWCVDSATRQIFLKDIYIKPYNGREFFNELRKSYRKIRGLKWYISMTTCAEIKLVKVLNPNSSNTEGPLLII